MELKAAILGRSLAHSVSPELHEMLFPILRHKVSTPFESISYEKLEFTDERSMIAWIGSAKAAGYHGANVTAPYKEAITHSVQKQSAEVRRIWSSNTLKFQPRIDARTTDGAGFIYALEKEGASNIAGKHLLILGAGGAARAILLSSLKYAPAKVTVAVRDVSRTKRIAHIAPTAEVISLEELSRTDDEYFVVQATPVGQASNEELAPTFEWRRGDVAADVVYNPVKTAFLSRAAQSRIPAISGIGMLIEQGALSQYFWLTGSIPPHSVLTNEEYHRLKDQLSPLIE